MMKNKALLYVLIAGAAILLISAKKKPSYKIEVPEPEKISEDQYLQQTGQKTLAQKVSQAVKKVKPVVQKIVKKKKKIGEFPEVC